MFSYILAIDDDPDALHLVKRMAQVHLDGHTLETVTDITRAITTIETKGLPAVVLVDLYLFGGETGFDFCKEVKNRGWDGFPILMLTSEDDGVVAGTALRDYVQDYIRKPFSSIELAERIKRAMGVGGNGHGLDFNLRQQKITLPGGATILLSTIEAKIFGVLFRHAGNCVSKQQLTNAVWQDVDGEKLAELEQYILRLRRKIEADPSRPQFIRTQRGKGYWLSLD